MTGRSVHMRIPGYSVAEAPAPGDDGPAAVGLGQAWLPSRTRSIFCYGELILLTDPNFLHRGERAHLGYGLVSRRLTEPDVDVRELPRIDGVVLSQLHGDHRGRRARRHLDRSVPIITTPHAARHLRTWQGFRRAGGLRTWESCTLRQGGSQVRVTSLPGRHALHPVLRRLLPPVMGSMLEEVGRRFPTADLAVLHLGGTTLPGGFVVTMDGAQGAELARRLDYRRILPVHYDDYSRFRSPLGDFLAEARELGLGERLVHCPRGQHTRVLRGERPAVR